MEAGQLLEIITDRPAIALEQLVRHGYPEAALYGRRLHVLCRQPDRDQQEISRLLRAANAGLRAINPQPLSMEDVFVYRVTALEHQERGVQPGMNA